MECLKVMIIGPSAIVTMRRFIVSLSYVSAYRFRLLILLLDCAGGLLSRELEVSESRNPFLLTPRTITKSIHVRQGCKMP